MGFYGNITNTSNTTFSFDRIYPNRLSMDANANNDGIFIGRYVLVEYDQDAAYPNVFLKDNQYYSSPNAEALTRVRFLSGERYDYIPTTDEYPIKGKQYYIKIEDSYIPADIKTDTKFEDLEITYYEKVESVDGVYEEEIVQVQEISTDDKGHTIYINIGFYECNGFVTENSIKYATFKKITKDPTAKSNYIQNFAIDEKHQDAEQQKSFKGYDSTVWVKSSIVNESGTLITKYVNIADLNSVVPTFDIAADAPTMEPITPHFDADSTNVYYKLHVQTPFGFRVKEELDENKSDVETTHYTTTYNKQNNTMNTGIGQSVNASIYYNQKGFDPNAKNSHVKDDNEQELPNYIKIEPTGKSSNYNNYSHQVSNYYKEIGKIKEEDWKQNTYYYLSNNEFKLSVSWSNITYYIKEEVGDIQEFSLHLPAIGNMMSDAWDIIHGPNRDNAQTDINSSLQGRLDSFTAMEKDAIPMKRNADGTFVGSRINGNNFKEVANNAILKESLSTSFDEDDAWIRTEINTTGLDNKNKLSGISIHHTFHEDNTNYDFSTNKNVDGIESENESDKIKLYTPKVDAAGHVVGKSIETVTLPYGYKHFKTDGLSSKDIVDDLYSTVNYTSTEDTKTTGDIANSSVAHNTQDILTINPHNKWIQTKIENTENDGDILTIAHEIHSIDERYDSNTNLNSLSVDNENEEGNLTIYDWDYDEAGHINKKRKHTYTLPYAFKYIDVTNDGKEKIAAPASTTGTHAADNTQDTLKLTTSNKWILLDGNSEDVIQFGHLLKTVPTTTSTQSLSDEVSQTITFEVYNDSFDEAGHHNGRDTKTITMPFGYGKIKGDTGSTEATATFDELTISANDSWIATKVSDDQVNITHTGPVVTSVTNKSNIVNPNFGSTFTIEDWHFDSKGHMHTSGKTHTVQFPKGSIEHPTATSNNSEIITSLSFVPESGKISYQKDNSSTLKLTTDYTNNGIGAGNIAGGDSLNTAFAKLEKQIMQEANTRATDILKEASDRDTAIKTAIADLVDSAPDNINTLGEIVAWLDNDGDEKIDIIKDIASNASKIEEEIGRATEAEQGLQDRIDALGTAAKENKEYFATAAQGSTADTTAATIATYGDIVTHNHSEYATAAQGELADNALPKDAEFIYTEEFKDTETNEILIPEVKMTIEQLVKKVAELENEIKILKGE